MKDKMMQTIQILDKNNFIKGKGDVNANQSIEDLEVEIARHRFNLMKDESPYICPICSLPYYIERICESRFDKNTEKVIPHTPIMTIRRK